MAEFHIDQPSGHLDQMIRQTRAHHVALSSLADLKASVLLTTAALVVPLTLRLTSRPDLRLAAYVMIGASLLTVLLAGYGTMPKFGTRRKRTDRLALLFFGDFASLDYEEYVARMQAVMNDPSQVYEIQLFELYKLGQYLEKAKYRYIRYAYVAFIGGVIASSLTWAITLWLI